jgi:hypothetical protein
MNEKRGEMWKEYFPVCFIELSQNLGLQNTPTPSITKKKKKGLMVQQEILLPQ